MAQKSTHPSSFDGTQSKLLDRFASAITARRAKWVIVVAWVVILAAVSPLAAKLSDAENNDAVTFLPESAESLQVAQLDDQFDQGDSVDAVIVYHRDSGLTAEDFATIEADRQAIAAEFPDYPLSEQVPSEDGLAAIFNLTLPGEDEVAIDGVDALREIVSSDVEGLDVSVTGPAGFLTDLVDVFDGIDETLLIAAAAVVTILLLFTYRSPFLWVLPLLSVAFANQTANATVYGLVEAFGVTVNGQTLGILPILVFGAGTDYALLFIARYREELRRHESTHDAMGAAIRSASPAILASAGTVIIGLLSLLLADLNTNQSLGPVGAAGILCALGAMMTLLPALLLIAGRRVFWPFIPRFGAESLEGGNVWGRAGQWVSARPRPVWVGASILLAAMTLGVIGVDTSLSQAEQFRDTPEAITGQELIAESYAAGAGQPNTVIANTAQAAAVEQAIAGTAGVSRVIPAGPSIDGTLTQFLVTFDTEPATSAAFDTVEALRDAVHPVEGANALVGGPDAESLDTQNAVIRDAKLVIPLIFLVVLAILCLLLRCIAAPVMLILTNILSIGAALGASAIIFDRVFGFGGIDPGIILLGFVFLVALGIDYNIFLMSRVHEEAKTLGTHAGMLKGLSVTGGVITSAGLVLAATFAVLGVLPLVPLTELGFLVAFGVLLDTLVVRSILVPALTFDFGGKVWWPGSLWARELVESERHLPQRRHPVTGD